MIRVATTVPKNQIQCSFKWSSFDVPGFARWVLVIFLCLLRQAPQLIRFANDLFSCSLNKTSHREQPQCFSVQCQSLSKKTFGNNLPRWFYRQSRISTSSNSVNFYETCFSKFLMISNSFFESIRWLSKVKNSFRFP